MANQLHFLFSEVLENNRAVLKTIAPDDHPLVTLLRTSLEDQKDDLENLVARLSEKNEPSLSDIKKYCTVVYHANEVSNPTFKSWKRTVEWQENPSRQKVEKAEPFINNMKKTLEKAAVEMEDLYGFLKVEYVIPAFYFPSI